MKLEQEIVEHQKNMELLQLKHESEVEKCRSQLEEQKKEVLRKNEAIRVLKGKEEALNRRMEESDKAYRAEIKLLMDKIENDKMNWYEREVQASGQREAQRVKELREILENKVQDREEEVKRLRDHIEKIEDNFSKQKEESVRHVETLTFELKELEKDKAR